MTDSSNSRPPKSSRKKPSREPATIDLKATVIDDGTHAARPQEDAKPEETISPEAEQKAQEAVATPTATLDSGPGTDSIGSGPEGDSIGPGAPTHEAAAQEPLSQEPPSAEPSPQELPPQDLPPRDRSPEAPPERRTSPAALIGAGLFGGLVGAGLVYGMQTWQEPQARQDDPRLAQLEQRVNALGQQRPPQGGDTQALQGRIQALETARAAVDQRLQGIQSTAERAAARAEEAMNRPVPQPPQAPQNNTALTELTNRLSALENQVRTGAQNAANAANAVQALDRRLSDQDRRTADQDRRLAELEQRLTEQGQRFAALSRQVTEENQGAEAASQAGIRVVLAGRLNDALRNGTPYADVLDGLRKAGADQGRLSALEPFAQEGAPTAAALAQSFKPLASTILREERAASGDWGDRVLRMFDKVVTVRPVNEPGSSGVPSLVARIEQALARGDVADAVAAWEALPEPSRRLSEEWGRQAKARAQAGQASQAIASDALAALNRSTQ